MSRVRTLDGDRPQRGTRAERASMLSVQSAQRIYAVPEVQRSPRGLRDPWLVLGLLVAAAVAVGWGNNPPLEGTSIDVALRLVQLLVAALPVLIGVAWLCAVLRTRVGGTGWLAPAALVGAASVWVLVLATVLVLHGADGEVCAGLPRCPTQTTERVLLGGVLGGAWVAARLLEGALVRRRAGAEVRAPAALRD
jgi:hypothetical protein